jgi:hypothetical protein
MLSVTEPHSPSAEAFLAVELREHHEVFVLIAHMLCKGLEQRLGLC